MKEVIELLKNNSELLSFANFDDRPGKLFEMIQHLRATIFISNRGEGAVKIFATKYNRWYTQNRTNLFKSIKYVDVTEFVNSFTIPKLSYELECSINRKIKAVNTTISSFYGIDTNNSVYYRAAGGGYFLLIKNQKSETIIDGVQEDVKAEKSIQINSEFSNSGIGAFISSSLFYWNYIAYTDCRNLTKTFIDSFNCPSELASSNVLSNTGVSLFADYEANKYRKDTFYASTGRNVIYDEYYPKKSKNFLDKVDSIVSKYFKFSETELDFIINFDIKYRMGDELNSEE